VTNSLTSLDVSSLKVILEGLYQEYPLCSYPIGKRIPLHDDEVCIISRGFVRTQTCSEAGEEAILGLIGPMMPVSSNFTLLNSYEVYALTSVDLLRLKWSEIEKSDDLIRELNHGLIHRLRHTEILLALQSKRQTTERLIGFLAFLAQFYGKPTSQGIRLEIRLTHQQIAHVLSTTRVTITRLMGALRKASLVSMDADRHFYIMAELSHSHDLEFSQN
jgi:CRP-like cAMP-binding protein